MAVTQSDSSVAWRRKISSNQTTVEFENLSTVQLLSLRQQLPLQEQWTRQAMGELLLAQGLQ